jgi:CoA-transferase family III
MRNRWFRSPIPEDLARCFRSLISRPLRSRQRDWPFPISSASTARPRRSTPTAAYVRFGLSGWTGPWKVRRGFDSLVQMSSGIAAAGMKLLRRARPAPLPVQALDHATGYLMAVAALRGLREQAESGRGSEWQLSLARTAALLTSRGARETTQALANPGPDDMSAEVENTSWGPARWLRPPLTISGTPLKWDRPAGALGQAAPAWGSRAG